ncbi:magnesium-translocating P-type ATPase [Candidatus Saccharibacteria bacterium]|nr:magnesium-translocating P-type ATPase [Candidatus Saccharibacteria bacterium]
MQFVNRKTRKKNGIRSNLTEENIRKYSTICLGDVYDELQSYPEGLTRQQALDRAEIDGLNTITAGSKDTTMQRLFEAIVNPFNIVLMVIAVITFFTDVVFASADEKSYLTFMIVAGLVGVASLISFIQSEKSSKAADKLSKMIVNKADVKRGDKFVEVLMEELVVGDVIKLAAGDMIPADVRFLTTKDLFIAQSALTGESNPVEKFSDALGDEKKALTDLPNIGFMGSNVVSGTATAIIITTGNNTYFGSMARSLAHKAPKNSFERGIDAISRLLIKFMLTMLPVLIIINIITKVELMDSILFAIAIAVGLTPEMLPVIFTTTLATGAIQMSKRNVIVKNMGSIQAFGEMDILCTDKTGTLTEDRIVLEKYINVHDQDDVEVLKRAYLNSYFQTGLKNMIDLSVIDRAKTDQVNDIAADYELADEIPYDFDRRRMSVILRHEDNHIITKGSVEEVLSICKYVKYRGKIIPLTKTIHDEAMKVYKRHNDQGLRMLAVAEKEIDLDNQEIYSVSDESEMTLVGFIGFLDPPKESAKKAIQALKEHGVRNIVLTGDSQGVAKIVCQKVGIDTELTLSGAEVESMSDHELYKKVERCNLFYKLSPSGKERIVKILQDNNHTVGYMGDGINDALPLKQADVGISVDNAVDIAKETADIILLEKDLLVLERGVELGRRTFGNIIKYIKMATSGNFGNMFSVVIASMFIPFLPMLPVHILVQNLLCDLSQLGIPFDHVDDDFIRAPRRWSTRSIKNFMYVLGPISSIFDCLCFIVLFYIIRANTSDLAPIFQCGWFVFGVISQVLVIHMIRTAKRPFLDSRASATLIISTLIIIILTALIGFTSAGSAIKMMQLPLIFAVWLAMLLAGYMLSIQLAKRIYIRKYGEWL